MDVTTLSQSPSRVSADLAPTKHCCGNETLPQMLSVKIFHSLLNTMRHLSGSEPSKSRVIDDRA
jgi:hypothetical protein